MVASVRPMTSLGRTDLNVFPLCLGGNVFGWTADEPESFAVLDAYVDAGGNFVDTANSYLVEHGRSETIIGRWMAERGNRDEIVLATKVGGGKGAVRNLRPDTIEREAAASLERLQTDRIDLYYLHRFDDVTDIGETLRAIDDLVRAGKIRYIGCSNFSGWHLMKSLAITEKYGLSRYVAHQAYYSLIGRDYEWELMPLGLDQGVGAVVWSPLGWGRLTGRVRRDRPAPTRRLKETAQFAPHVDDARLHSVIDVLDEISAETDKSIPQIALNWLLQRPTVATILIGARNEEQLRDNLGAVGWNLNAAQIARLDAASALVPPYPYYPYWNGQFAERTPPAVKV